MGHRSFLKLRVDHPNFGQIIEDLQRLLLPINDLRVENLLAYFLHATAFRILIVLRFVHELPHETLPNFRQVEIRWNFVQGHHQRTVWKLLEYPQTERERLFDFSALFSVFELLELFDVFVQFQIVQDYCYE